ncbi:hypothetical protein DBR33_01275 [Stenotrophomonas sp. HMWF022]|uniref:hypothetical protein n=1 Tax=Stenotrophomonas sp. HMWF023 TaxID=2056859 RepID=UPI000D3C553E|nr:hypothetical protein [Stenotrophomonas sp. HMWF023]PTS71882.1 hypothetical protein DBR20_20705 [Stenotrophomonas sp. HMWF023]PTT57891.1 hypothetical protein DBR33_01275 [Stenotrophomonas sp. HMWF022]
MIEKVLAVLSDIATIAAAGLAFYLFFAKGSELRAMLNALANLAHQSSLSEIRQKLDLVASLRVQDEREEIVSILHDVCGQIDGNPKLKDAFSELTDRVKKASSTRRVLTEPQKRSIVSELREKLRHSDVSSIAGVMGDLDK